MRTDNHFARIDTLADAEGEAFYPDTIDWCTHLGALLDFAMKSLAMLSYLAVLLLALLAGLWLMLPKAMP